MPAAVRCQIPALASPDPGVGPKRSPTPPYLSGLTWLLHPLEFGPPHSTKVPRDSSHSLSSQGTELGLSRSDSALAAPAPPLDPPLPLRCRLGLGVQTHLQTPLLSPAQRGQRGRRGCQGLKKRRVPEEEGLHRGLRCGTQDEAMCSKSRGAMTAGTTWIPGHVCDICHTQLRLHDNQSRL
ncbi:uncharacterized protein LOC123334135 isoform X3 [Bubalus bubalis]|uniref:uncharacterized protein LOC123334135 isoform X3 n=1 Tax=Bubalus bubalis TaxID=89462 RepID=UPI001D0F8F61|nr:uncharacterized protein LOC123334135 isoform X3 [Bubalus bubalis]